MQMIVIQLRETNSGGVFFPPLILFARERSIFYHYTTLYCAIHENCTCIC